MVKFLLESENYFLGPFEKSDCPRIADLCNNIKIYRNNLSLPYPYSLQDALDWVDYLDQAMDPNRFMALAIRDKKHGQVLGCLSMEFSQVHRRVEVGYWLGEPYWNKGIMTEVLKRVIKYVFEERNYHKVYGTHFSYNQASGRVMEKAGMVYEGTLKGHLKRQDEYIDLVCYGLTVKDYKK